MTAICVVQARMGSSRLPGKVLADLGGRPLLAFMLDRLAPLPMDVVVATSDLAQDDPVARVAERAGAAVVRGSEKDVLARYALVLDRYHPDAIVRLTADCPLVDPALVEQALAVHVGTGAAYVSNTLVRTFPDGLDVEVVTTAALRAAATEAVDPAEREHVTPFVYRRPGRFSLRSFRTDELAGEERWTVDTAADLDFVRATVERLGGAGPWDWRAVLDVTGRRCPPPAQGELRLRPAQRRDSELLLAWRDDPDAVRFSRSGRAVPPAVHRAWFEARIDDPSTRIWVGEVDGAAAGQVRVDVEDATGLVSIAVARGARGGGVAGSLLRGLETELGADLQVTRLVAEVRHDNEPSIRAFHRAGYVHRGDAGDFHLLERTIVRTTPAASDEPDGNVRHSL